MEHFRNKFGEWKLLFHISYCSQWNECRNFLEPTNQTSNVSDEKLFSINIECLIFVKFYHGTQFQDMLTISVILCYRVCFEMLIKKSFSIHNFTLLAGVVCVSFDPTGKHMCIISSNQILLVHMKKYLHSFRSMVKKP